jgi:Ceramidase
MNRNLKLYLLAFLTLAAIAGVFSVNHIPQSVSYHNFCDKRRFWGIANFVNVASNLPFVVTGIAGLFFLRRSTAHKAVTASYFFLFMGIILTGFGSAYYHLSPDSDTLVFDRLPMTIVFMSLLAAIAGEAIGPGTGAIALTPLLLAGAGSILWWHYTERAGAGDLRLYVLVQYYPMILIPMILLLFPGAATRRGWPPLLWAFGWYFIAKGCELLDCGIYSTLGFISGHSLKHLAAAVSTWLLVKRYRVMHVPPLVH